MHYFFSALSWLFIVGMVGSGIVIIVTFLDDLTEIFGEDKQVEDASDELPARIVPVQ
jgi:hypothetical protein